MNEDVDVDVEQTKNKHDVKIIVQIKNNNDKITNNFKTNKSKQPHVSKSQKDTKNFYTH